jgi:glucan 1,3-beta-glucosidase
MDNAETYWNQVICGMLAWGYNIIYFEAFDEPAKAPRIGKNGKPIMETYWGAMSVSRADKFPLTCGKNDSKLVGSF